MAHAAILDQPTRHLEEARELTFAEQATALHTDIFSLQNGVPSVENYNVTWQLAQDIEYDPHAYNAATDTYGAYFGPKDEHGHREEIDGSVAEDLKHIADPGTWLHTTSDRHVLKEASDRLFIGILDEEPGVKARARIIAERVVDDPDDIKGSTLDRMLVLEAEVRRQLAEQHVDKETIHGMELRNAHDISLSMPAAPARGVLHKETQEEVLQQAEAVDGDQEDRLYKRGRVAKEAVDGAEYARKIDEAEDGKILAQLIAAESVIKKKDWRGREVEEVKHIETADEVAGALFPERIGGARVYGQILWRGKEKKDWENKLSEAEQAEVRDFTRQLADVRLYEKAVEGEFKAGTGIMPTEEQISAKLFPQAAGELTESQQMAVDATMARLREHRDGMVRRDRTAWLRRRWEGLQAGASRTKEWTTEAVAGTKEFVQTSGTRVGQAIGAGVLSMSLALGSLPGQEHRALGAESPREVPVSTTWTGRGREPEEEEADDALQPWVFEGVDGSAGIYPARQSTTVAAESAEEQSRGFDLATMRAKLLTKAQLTALGIADKIKGLRRPDNELERREYDSRSARSIVASVGVVAAAIATKYLAYRLGIVTGNGSSSSDMLAGTADGSIDSDMGHKRSGTTSAAGDFIGPEQPVTDSTDTYAPELEVNTDEIGGSEPTSRKLGEWNPEAHTGSVRFVTEDYMNDLGWDYKDFTPQQRDALAQRVMDYNDFNMPSDQMPTNLDVKLPPRGLMEEWILDLKPADT